MPTQLELCVVAFAVGALLGGAGGYTVTHRIDGAALSKEKAAHADDIARINATAAKQLADALAKQQAAEGKVYTLQQQFNDEIAAHAKDSLDYRARLLAGTQRVRVHVSGCGVASTNGQSTAAANGNDDSTTYGFLPPANAASVAAVADDADTVKAQLIALQQYVQQLQDDGYISNGK